MSETIEITILDLLPLDKGTGASTSYEFGPEVMTYMLENGLLDKETKIGHIHSHHNMDSYFSSVDLSEVHDNSEFMHPYLSLIVNNKGKFVCKLVFRTKSKSKTTEYIVKDLDEKERIIKIPKDEELIFVYNCDVIKPLQESIDKPFLDQVEKICIPKPTTFSNVEAYSFYDAITGKTYIPKNTNASKYLIDNEDLTLKDVDWGFGLDDEFDLFYPGEIEHFYVYVMMLGAAPIHHNLDLNGVIDNLEASEKQAKNRSTFISNYIFQLRSFMPKAIENYYVKEIRANQLPEEEIPAYGEFLLEHLVDEILITSDSELIQLICETINL